MTMRAVGPFEVKLSPQAPDPGDAGGPFGRLLIDKRFQGELEGTSRGQMLAAGTATKGSAGYVALEEVTGTLAGRRGTFFLQHSGVMNRGAAALALTVVPDSGTGELEGLSGSMMIKIDGARHSYEFEYMLPGAG